MHPHSSRGSHRWPATLLAVAVAAIAGCGGGDDPPAPPTAPVFTTTPAPPAVPLSAPGRAARAYALAARSWTPSTYRAQYRKQLRLSTGGLHRALQNAAPTEQEIAAYRADRARLKADVADVQRVSETPNRARYTVTLNETSIAGGQTVKQRSVNVADLRRDRERWLVSGFTVQP